MTDRMPSRNSIYYLQKKIVDLSREYYNAIKNNITFENIKVIFLKRKKLQQELSDIRQSDESSKENYQEENLNSSLSLTKY
jgi:hypothetical protein